MPLSQIEPYYNAGSATFVTDSAIVTGVGTAWLTNVEPGDQFYNRLGQKAPPVLTVNSNTQVTLRRPFRGTAQAANEYEVYRVPDSVRLENFSQRMVNMLAGTNLVALAALDGTGGDKLIKLTGAGAAETFNGENVLALAGLAGAANKIARFTSPDDMDLITAGSVGVPILAADDFAEAQAAMNLGKRRVPYAAATTYVLNSADYFPAYHYAYATGLVTLDVTALEQDRKYRFYIAEPTSLILDCSGGADRFQGDGALVADNVTAYSVKGPATVTMMKVAGGRIHMDYKRQRSGVYTPTLYNTTNVAASTAFPCLWQENKDVGEVAGFVQIDVTAANTNTVLGMSLPPGVASNFAATSDAGGVAFATSTNMSGLGIYADIANDRVAFAGISSAGVANQSYAFHFMYRVL